MRHSWYSSVGRETTQIDVVLEKRLKDLQRFVATETITNKYMQFSHCSVLSLLVKNSLMPLEINFRVSLFPFSASTTNAFARPGPRTAELC